MMVRFSVCFCFNSWRQFCFDGASPDKRVGGQVCIEFIDSSESVFKGDDLCRFPEFLITDIT